MNPRIASWQGRRVWIVGASSGIGRATASALHALGALVHVSARDARALAEFAASHPGAVALPLDVCEPAQLRDAARRILAGGTIDLVMYSAGHYRAMRATGFDLREALRHQQVNFAGALHLLDAVLPSLLARGGHVSLVASVAGYRGLPNGLAYGPTKAALIHLAENLYLDLHDLGVGVSVINPGFVETPMTAQNTFRMPALLTPEQAARAIVRGWEQGRFEIHFPARFTGWLKLLRVLPFSLYARIVRKWTGL
jgi:NAD(P)-dependent dehydrogenase (short-subunit alcohol dehydrogenase family)